MQTLTSLILETNQQTIHNIILFYSSLSLPAFIRIETGTPERHLIITPCWAINQWKGDRWSELVFGQNRETFFNGCLNPYKLCSYLYSENESQAEEFQEILETLAPYSGLIAIEYEHEDMRELFEPIVVSCA